jgi:hypothetical protein
MLRNATGFAWADRPIRLIESPIAAGEIADRGGTERDRTDR